ncbi:MAG TPA: phenylacetate--CoA ligase, partial [Geobacter sp.]|nr:phenylacetate--CoA ligase [Geobacter sp.]
MQLKRLKSMVARVEKNVPFYQESLAKAGITSDSIKSLADLARLPFTYKQD